MNSFRFVMQGINAEIARQTALRRGRRAGRAGDAALRPGRAADQLAALQGGGARLPLLPGARPRPGRADARRCWRPPAPRCPSCRPSAPSATSASCGLPDGHRAPVRLRARVGRLLRGGRAPATAPTGAVANWVDRAARAARGRRPGRVAGRPAALARLVALVGGQARSRPATRRDVLDKLVAEGGDPAAIVEREGLGAMGTATSSPAIVAAGDRGQPGRRRAHPRRQREGDGRARRPVMRETKGRADGGEVNRLIREQLGV